MYLLCFPLRFKQLGFMYGGCDEVRDSSWCLQSGTNVVGSMEICALGSSRGGGVLQNGD